MPLVLVAVFLAWHFATPEPQQPTIAYSTFFKALTNDEVARVTIKGRAIRGELKKTTKLEGHERKAFQTLSPSQDDPALLPLLHAKGVEISVKSEQQPFLLELLVYVAPILIFVVLWVWLSRKAQGMMSSGGIGGVLKPHTRRFEKEAQVPVRFDDVAGLLGAKQDLQEIVDFLRSPERFRKVGGKVPRGVLLVGPPGTGKTLLARAAAGESGVPFFSINGSEFIELFVGVGASRVRDLFAEAKRVAPAIIFIDEIDAVGRARGAGLGGGHDEREQTLNQLLSEMDGFTRNDHTVVLAATNRPDVLDSALLRPGRFDRRVIIDRPELAARRAILDVHTRGKPLASDVVLDEIAGDTPGFSGADLANLVNEAALSAVRRAAETIEMHDFRAAYDKIVLGDPRETKLDAVEKERVATHEAGHTVVAHFSAHAEPPNRVSIIPRGMALGVTHQTPGADRHIMTQPELEARLAVMMGGYAAERVLLGDVSSGAENDLKRASDLAFKMVAHYGMSERIGPVFYEHRTEHPFLGQTLATEGGTSDATVHLIEQEARALLAEAVDAAMEVIRKHQGPIGRLIEVLIKQETVERDDLSAILGDHGGMAGIQPLATPSVQ